MFAEYVRSLAFFFYYANKISPKYNWFDCVLNFDLNHSFFDKILINIHAHYNIEHKRIDSKTAAIYQFGNFLVFQINKPASPKNTPVSPATLDKRSQPKPIKTQGTTWPSQFQLIEIKSNGMEINMCLIHISF